MAADSHSGDTRCVARPCEAPIWPCASEASAVVFPRSASAPVKSASDGNAQVSLQEAPEPSRASVLTLHREPRLRRGKAQIHRLRTSLRRSGRSWSYSQSRATAACSLGSVGRSELMPSPIQSSPCAVIDGTAFFSATGQATSPACSRPNTFRPADSSCCPMTTYGSAPPRRYEARVRSSGYSSRMERLSGLQPRSVCRRDLGSQMSSSLSLLHRRRRTRARRPISAGMRQREKLGSESILT